MKTVQKQQVPGYYRQQIGELFVTALYDGYINLSPSLFHGVDTNKMQTLIDNSFQTQTSEGIPTAITTYLIDNGTDIILLNTGGGKNADNSMGGIIDNLDAAGYTPEDITAILLTHMHFDHICGLVNEKGEAMFPNATVYVSEKESNYWLDPKIAEAAPEGNRAFFEMAVNSVAPYKRNNSFITFKDNAQILPGIQSIPSIGHTPGHTSYLVGSKENKLLLWGDIVHSHAMQFSHPEITNDFDSDQPQAAISRNTIFEKSVQENLLIAGDHLPFPGFGHLRKIDNGYMWIPVEYSEIK